MPGRVRAVQSYGRRVGSVKGEQQEHSTEVPNKSSCTFLIRKFGSPPTKINFITGGFKTCIKL